MDEPVVQTYMRFVQALLCSRSEFVQMVIDKIVKSFRFRKLCKIAIYSHCYRYLTLMNVLEYLHSSVDDKSPSNLLTRRQTCDRLHHLLHSLIQLIPTLPSAIWPLLNRHFPHKRENRNSQVVYMTNALRIVEYCPQLAENVLDAVILRAIQIDVEIQVDLEELEDGDGILDEEIFGFSVANPFDRLITDEDLDSDSDESEGDGVLDPDAISSDDGSSDEEEEKAELNDGSEAKEQVLSAKIIKRLKEMAAKLDAVLRVIFDFLQRLNAASAPTRYNLASSPIEQSFPLLSLPFDHLPKTNHTLADKEEEVIKQRLSAEAGVLLRRSIFDVLLNIFDDKILRTFQTRHTQFLLFWYSSLSPDFTDHFLGNLVGRALDDKDTPVITRVAAAGYVASFVSRSMSIDRLGARKVMSLLCSFIEDEMDQLRPSNNAFLASSSSLMDSRTLVKNSVVYYAVCQAAFYIFCFRWKDLLDENEEEIDLLEGVLPARRWLSDLDVLKEAISGPLNPLKVGLAKDQALQKAHFWMLILLFGIL